MFARCIAAIALVMVSAFSVEARASSWSVTLSGSFYDSSTSQGTFSQTITMNTSPSQWSSSDTEQNGSFLYLLGEGPPSTVSLTINGSTFTSTVESSFGYQILNSSEPGRTYLQAYFVGQTQDGQALVVGNQAYVDTWFNWGVSQTIDQHLEPLEGMSANFFLTDASGNQTAFMAMPDHIRVVVNAVPEPETYAMFLVGLAAVGFVARRRKNKVDRSALN